MINKRGFEFSFAWMFAIIVGAVIIFLAIYGTVRLIGTERKIQDTEVGKELGIILNPIETGVEEGKSASIILQSETRMFNECDTEGTFGIQDIRVATKSGIGAEWEKPGVASSFRNKYIFSSSVVEGKKYRVFSKPFEMPFKIADLLYILSEDDKYCFVDLPREIENEINDLGLAGISISDELCEGINVCFQSSEKECDVIVSLEGKSVKKKFSEPVYYEGNTLLYGAIFAEPRIYECQVKRLMRRASELALLYNSKSVFLEPKGCRSNLGSDLMAYANASLSIDESLDLKSLSLISEDIRRRNEALSCKLF